MIPLLEVRNLKTHFETERGIVRAVDDVSLEVGSGQTLGVVGESGCGKTVLALSLLRLVPLPGRTVSGAVLLKGQDLLTLSPAKMQALRGREISMIFQEPMTSLNPVLTVGEQIAEVIRLHQGIGQQEAREMSVQMLKKVGIPSPETRISHYPHQMSGGMRQRVMIAIALVCRPCLMLADEPTTALDVTIQAQVLDLIQQLQAELGTSVLMITHDLGVIAAVAHHMAVMYAGQIVEQGATGAVLTAPCHPYTRGLMASLPRIQAARKPLLEGTPGSVPALYNLPDGCRFQDRCPERLPLCGEQQPQLATVAAGHAVRCWRTEIR